MEINITCGQYANDYYSSTLNGIFIPFNEAMIQGNIKYPLFEEEFIEERIKSLNTNKEEYLNKLNGIISLKEIIHNIKIINCYFGEDEFCKVNVYYLFKYLMQLNYNNKIILNIIDETTYEIKNTVPINCIKTYIETCGL